MERHVLVVLTVEEDGGYSAVAPELPGVASQGETEDEALSNIREAVTGAIEYYLDELIEVPWQRVPLVHGIVRWVKIELKESQI